MIPGNAQMRHVSSSKDKPRCVKCGGLKSEHKAATAPATWENDPRTKRLREYATENILSNSREVTREELDRMPLNDIATLYEMISQIPPGYHHGNTLLNSAIRSMCGKPAKPEPATADYSMMGFPSAGPEADYQARFNATRPPTMADAIKHAKGEKSDWEKRNGL